ncbi:MAG: YncE family protein [Gammaproteobacteria bacterium]
MSKQFTVVCHINDGDRGEISLIKFDGAEFSAIPVKITSGSQSDDTIPKAFVGADSEGQFLFMDQKSKVVTVSQEFPENTYVPYAYPGTNNNEFWYVNDGDKKTGVDDINCNGKGSSVVVIARNDNESGVGQVNVKKTICVGRGHHVVTIPFANSRHPDIPRHAYVSNLLDGTISVLSNDEDSPDYLEILNTINLCEPEKEKSATMSVPNNAFPHGLAYSPETGKVYNLNNGYQTIVVIDPIDQSITNRIELKVSSNLLLSPDSLYLIGKGADRKSDDTHVIGRLSVIDIVNEKVETAIDLIDLYPSTYRFNKSGDKLYVTSASTGKGVQKENLKFDVLQIYDATALPKLELLKEIKVGVADCGRRPLAFFNDDVHDFVFVPNPTDGTISVLDGKRDEIIATLKVTNLKVSEVTFSFWQGNTNGC